jgi:hypothetical protein
MVTYSKKVEPWQAKLGTSTFNPLQVIDMQTALRKRAKSAVVQGRKFLLTYYKVKEEQKVFYRPADDSFAPAGHLDVDRFLEEI